jgi:hypothetical protein
MPVILKPEPKFGLSKFSIDRRAKADDQGQMAAMVVPATTN